MQDSIPGSRVHTLSRSQTLHHWATQASLFIPIGLFCQFFLTNLSSKDWKMPGLPSQNIFLSILNSQMICPSCVDLNIINNLIALKVLNSFGNSPLNLSPKYPIACLTSPLEYLKDISNSKCWKPNSSFYSSVSFLWKRKCAHPVYCISAKGIFFFTATQAKNLWTIFESSFLLYFTSSPLEIYLNSCFASYLIYEYIPPSSTTNILSKPPSSLAWIVFKLSNWGCLGDSVVEHLPPAQIMILGSWDQAPHRSLLLTLPVSLPLSVHLSWINKYNLEKKINFLIGLSSSFPPTPMVHYEPQNQSEPFTI